MTNATRVRRLRKWAAYLRGPVARMAKRGKFNMGVWSTGPFPERCSTAACALGHAATIFRRQGLRLSPDGCGDESCENWIVTFGTLDGEEAAVAFFGVTTEEAIEICMPRSYEAGLPSPQEVARRIAGIARGYERGR